MCSRLPGWVSPPEPSRRATSTFWPRRWQLAARRRSHPMRPQRCAVAPLSSRRSALRYPYPRPCPCPPICMFTPELSGADQSRSGQPDPTSPHPTQPNSTRSRSIPPHSGDDQQRPGKGSSRAASGRGPHPTGPTGEDRARARTGVCSPHHVHVHTTTELAHVQVCALAHATPCPCPCSRGRVLS